MLGCWSSGLVSLKLMNAVIGKTGKTEILPRFCRNEQIDGNVGTEVLQGYCGANAVVSSILKFITVALNRSR